jgi:hypothetical protein
VKWYVDFLTAQKPRGIVEVGMWDGASVALAAEVAMPDKLVGIDRQARSTAALDDFVTRKGLSARVRPYYGVDQADRAAISSLIETELRDVELDLVVDDASHQLGPTRKTFNCLYPMVRPGGNYVIEDWVTHSPFAAALVEGPPLTLFALELVLACSERPDIVADVLVSEGYLVVTKGDASVDRHAFDVSLCLGPEARSLLPAGSTCTTRGGDVEP